MTSGGGFYINVLCASQLTFRFLDYMLCPVFSGEIVLPWVAGRGASASGTGSDWSFAGGECTISAEADFTSLAKAQAQAFGPRTMIRDMRNRLCLDVSLPCQVCSSFATGTCAYCGRWTCDKHLTSTEGTREGYMFDERWCRPCYRGFHGGLPLPASATQAQSHEAHPHGCLWRPSAQQPQCLHCGGPIVDKADPVTCAHCGEAVHRRCFKCALRCCDGCA